MQKKLFIGVLISGACLYFVFRDQSFGQVLGALRQTNPFWLLLALLVYSATFFLRVERWAALLHSVKPVPVRRLFNPLIIGFFANNVLPFRMGEVVRAIVTGKKLDISRTAALGTIVLERICDAVSFLIIFLVMALFFPFPQGIKHGAAAMGLGCIIAITVLILGSRHQTRAHDLLERLPLAPKIRESGQSALANFASGVSALTHGASLARIAPLSLGVWLIEGTVIYLIIRAFPVHITFPQAFFVLFFLGLSVTLPQAPGYVGAVELFGVTALSLLGIPKEQGLPMILTIHGIQFALIFILGFRALWTEGMSFGSLLKSPIDNPPTS